jgi:hypothetical protein
VYPCRGLEAAMILYYFQLMGGRKAWVLQEHLSRCHRCKDYWKRLEKVSRMAREDRDHPRFIGEEALFPVPGMTVHR